MAVTPIAQRRVLHYGDKGRDVKAYQRAARKTLKALGFVSNNRATGLYGPGTLADTLRLQKAEGITATGRVGALTWTAVDPNLDLYGKFLLAAKPKPPTPPGARVAHEARVLATFAPRHYTQTRPYAGTVALWASQGGDCSGTSILAYKLAGVPDPNGTNFDGYGNTYSLVKRGIQITPAQSIAGDLTFYNNIGHVTVELGDGNVFSMGSEGGPRILPRQYGGAYVETRRYA